jgi:hypothetical protein
MADNKGSRELADPGCENCKNCYLDTRVRFATQRTADHHSKKCLQGNSIRRRGICNVKDYEPQIGHKVKGYEHFHKRLGEAL